MSNSFFNKFKSKKAVGILLLLSAIASYPFINYYFGNFYSGRWDDFKNWYPDFHLIIYPFVKALPYVFLTLLLWLFWNAIQNFIRTVRKFVTRFPSADTAVKLKQLLMNVLLMCISALVILGIAEFALRIADFKPGFRLSSQYFTEIDSLYNLKAFVADRNGILCVSPDAREFIRKEIATKNSKEELTQLDRLQSTEVYTLPEDFIALRKPGYTSEFKSFLATLNNPDSSDREFFDAIKEYVKSPINSNGFKSIEFKKYPSKRKSILMLGDSFTWGHSSSNKTNGFADVLLAKGYVVYNTGITSTDPAQYLQIAKVLVPQLQPDYVVVNFYMGNDITFFERKPEPYVPLFYCTNAGNLISCPEGIYFYDAQEAYQHTLDVFKIPAENNRLNKFCSKTVIGTLFWRILAKYNLVDAMLPKYVDYYSKVRNLTTKTPFSDIQLREIEKITEEYNGRFLLTVIPSLDGKDFLFPEEKQPLFIGLDYFVPPILLEHYEQKIDGHYNDSGHKMHAEFIDSLIKNL